MLRNLANTNKRETNYAFVCSVTATLVLCVWFSFLMREYTADDALIYYRYIRNCLEGNGLVYNIGERFNGLTSPLYTYLSLAVAYLFRGNIQYTQIGLGALLLFFTSVMTIRVFNRTLSWWRLVFLPPLLSSSVFFYKTFGLETMLFLFLILTALYFFNTKRFVLFGIVCALLLLTRGESFFLILTFFVVYLIQYRQVPPVKVYIMPCIILLLHGACTYFYYGSVLPNTLSAKIHQGTSGLWGRCAFMHHIPHFIDWFWGGNGILPAGMLLIALFGIRTAWNHVSLRILLIFFLLYCAFYIVLNIPDYFWYYGYVFLVMYLLVICGLEKINDMLKNMQVGFFRKYHSAIIACISFFLCTQQSVLAYTMLNGLQGQTHYRTIGTWIREHTEPNAKIACIEIGHIGWYSQRYIIDILGLVNPYNAQYIGQRKFDGWLKHYTPDYILVWVPLRPHEISVQKLLNEKRYVLFHEFDFNGWKFQLLRRDT